jgi:hypothetical protein
VKNYLIRCYKAKMLQIFHYVANHTQSQYLFYVESDNTLCVPLPELERIAQSIAVLCWDWYWCLWLDNE